MGFSRADKASECSLEEEILNPAAPSATKAELCILPTHADSPIKELHLFTLFNKALKPQRRFFIETPGRTAVQLPRPSKAPIF